MKTLFLVDTGQRCKRIVNMFLVSSVQGDIAHEAALRCASV